MFLLGNLLLLVWPYEKGRKKKRGEGEATAPQQIKRDALDRLSGSRALPPHTSMRSTGANYPHGMVIVLVLPYATEELLTSKARTLS